MYYNIGDYTYCGEYRIVESTCDTPETNITLYIIWISVLVSSIGQKSDTGHNGLNQCVGRA